MSNFLKDKYSSFKLQVELDISNVEHITISWILSSILAPKSQTITFLAKVLQTLVKVMDEYGQYTGHYMHMRLNQWILCVFSFSHFMLFLQGIDHFDIYFDIDFVLVFFPACRIKLSINCLIVKIWHEFDAQFVIIWHVKFTYIFPWLWHVFYITLMKLHQILTCNWLVFYAKKFAKCALVTC
jgi:hypothetical protein